MAEDAGIRFQQVAERRGRATDELWQEVRVSDAEFARARLTYAGRHRDQESAPDRSPAVKMVQRQE
jgi:hypothetical protein